MIFYPFEYFKENGNIGVKTFEVSLKLRGHYRSSKGPSECNLGFLTIFASGMLIKM